MGGRRVSLIEGRTEGGFGTYIIHTNSCEVLMEIMYLSSLPTGIKVAAVALIL